MSIENNYRNQVNVIYGSPTPIVSQGESRNLVQFAEPKVKRYRDPIEELEHVLTFGYGEDWKKKMKKQENNEGDKRITQAGIPNLGKKLSILEHLLKFGGDL